MLVAPGRSVYACPVVRDIFQVSGLRVLVSFVPSVFLLACFSVPLRPSPPCCSFVFGIFLFHCDVTGDSVLFHFYGSPWLGCAIVQVMGASFNLRADCQKWKPLDHLGTQLTSCDTVVNLCLIFLLGCFCRVISSQQKNTPS